MHAQFNPFANGGLPGIFGKNHQNSGLGQLNSLRGNSANPLTQLGGLGERGAAQSTGGLSSLLDHFAPSTNFNGDFTYSKSQFLFQQSTVEYMESDNGFSYYQKDISIEITSEKFRAGSLDEEALGKLTDYFSPENTANRISNMATSFFPLYAQREGLEDTPENRQQFVDYITPAIDKGYEQALGDIGSLPDDIASELEKTMELVKESLAAFGKGEKVGYRDKIDSLIDEQFSNADADGNGLLSIKESGLSSERFAQLDEDEDGLVSKDEIASLIDQLDSTKDLDEDLVLSILDPQRSPQELAAQAKGLLAPDNRISMETLSINIVVSETIIEYSEESDNTAQGSKKPRHDFAAFLDRDREAQDEINRAPGSIKEHLLKYKLESVLEQLKKSEGVFEKFGDTFLKENPEKLDFLFKNPKMADFFGNNPDSADKFLS